MKPNYNDPIYDDFRKRGIDPATERGRAVIEARRYFHYEAGDVEPIYAADERLRAPEFEGWVKHVVKRHEGWAMRKHAVLPDHPIFGEDPLVQVRPGGPVPGSPKGHDHYGMQHKEGTGCPCGIGDHSMSYRTKAMKRRTRERHENGKHHVYQDGPNAGQPIPLPGYDPETGHGPHLHRSVSDDELIPATRAGKYQLTPKTPHDPSLFLDELEPREEAVYTNPGRRLDRNPLTDFDTAEWVAISSEGTLKCDALTAAGVATLDYPSVTLWDAEAEKWEVEFDFENRETIYRSAVYHELEEFARRYLVDRAVPTVVVCDSDWHTNPFVWTHANLCADFLRTLGVPVAVASPPEGHVLGTHYRTGKPIKKKVGVDDFLGPELGYPHGGPLDLIIYEAEPPSAFRRFERDVEHHRGPSGVRLNEETRKRLVDEVAMMVNYANDDLEVVRYPSAMTRQLQRRGVDINDPRALLRDLRILEREFGFGLEEGEWNERAWWDSEAQEWRPRKDPAIVTHPEALRATRTTTSVRAWLAARSGAVEAVAT